MTTRPARLGMGSEVVWEGERRQVVEFNGTTALLRGRDGGFTSVTVTALLEAHAPPGSRDADEEDAAYGQLLALKSGLDPAVSERAAHVREVITGYRSGSEELAGDGEPREQFDPSRPKGERYQAKATELGVGVATVRGWVARYQRAGPAGLVDGRRAKAQPPLAGLDPRWLDTARAVIEEQVGQATPSKSVIIQRVAARLERDHGPDVVALPGKTRAYEALGELGRGRNTFAGSAKARRSIANRPDAPYGRLRATRPGEYVLLDTTPLDVFAMEPVTLRWVRAELTAALDLYSRCILGITVTPTTKSVDVAALLYESISPPELTEHWPPEAAWPYHGLPATVVVDADRVDGPLRGAVRPPLLPETVVVDHGRVYVSEHITSVCARLGISIQPARKNTPTDKSPLERWFKTLRTSLLEVLPGYKGPDVFSRGEHPEGEAFFFLHELEDIIREWTAVIYHRRGHDGLGDPHAPGVELSPVEMFGHGVARAGYLTLPPDPGLVYQLLPVVWRLIQHYGVEHLKQRYSGAIVVRYANRRSPYPEHDGRWPIHVNPDDLRWVYLRDPDDGTWHTLTWEHAADLDLPFSVDALAYARRLAGATDPRHPDVHATLARLLQDWNVGLAESPRERRIALRLARQRPALAPPDPAQSPEPPDSEVTQLASLQKVTGPRSAPAPESAPTSDTAGMPSAEPASDPGVPGRHSVEPDLEPEFGDDDDPDDFYATALEDV